jgi:hypothetical protein
LLDESIECVHGLLTQADKFSLIVFAKCRDSLLLVPATAQYFERLQVLAAWELLLQLIESFIVLERYFSDGITELAYFVNELALHFKNFKK